MLIVFIYHFPTMASIQYTGLVSEIQGKLNGSVLSRGRASAVIYSKPKPRKEPTQAQLAIRAGFANSATSWRSLTDTERDEWQTIADNNPLPNRFGDLVAVSGYAYFKRMMSLAFPTSGGSPLIPNLTNDPAYQFTPDGFGAEMQLTNAGYKVNFAVLDALITGDSPQANQWNVYVSLPVPQANFPYFKTWYFVASSFFPSDEGVGNPLQFAMGNKTLPKGFRTFEGALHLWKAVCFVPGHGSVSVEQIWSGVASWVGPVTFPTFEYDDGGVPGLAYGGSEGILDYYWACTQGNLIRSDFTQQTQFAPPQATQAPVPDGDWESSTNSGFTGIGGDTIIIPTSPGGPTAWYGVWYADVGSAWTPVNGWWAPVRMRLIHIETGQEGPWTVGYWPITLA